MQTPDLTLPKGRSWRTPIEYNLYFTITSDLVLSTRPGNSRPFTMLATRLLLHWWWDNDEWNVSWAFWGRRRRKTKDDWSPHEQGFLNDFNADLPDWVLPLIEANAPTMTPTAGGKD